MDRKMKAVVWGAYGPPDILKMKMVDVPVPKKDGILVKVHASTVNRTDLASLMGKPFIARSVTGMTKPKHPIIGTEFAGVVESVGSDVRDLRVGDRVFGLNEKRFGALAEYMVIGESEPVVKIPKNVSFKEAAAVSEGSWYAQNIYNKVDFKKGQTVLINGATGAIGSASVQLGKHFGARITATCRKDHFDLVKDLGAERCIDYTMEDFIKESIPYDYVFDAVGRSTFAKCKPVIKDGGSYVSTELGPWSQNLILSIITPFFGRKKVRFPYPTNCRGCLQFTRTLLSQGEYKAVIDREYPLEDVIDAFKYVVKGQKVGSVLIKVSE